MTGELCTLCMGSGEGIALIFDDPNDGTCVLSDCFACQGTGFKRPHILRKNNYDAKQLAIECCRKVGLIA